LKSPVLFLVFNRPDTTRQVFEVIRAAKPPRLYVAADGPRVGRDGESDRCEEVRRIATNVDWPCEVKTLFRDSNLGCKYGVSGGINWFFKHETEGIILEDDVLPLSSFFDYCDELLERYRHNDAVAMISGCNLVSAHFQPECSYFFSLYNHIWGWASWRRTWVHYDVAMKEWPLWCEEGGLKKLANGNKQFESYWRNTFNNVFAGNIDTWDFQWTFTCWFIQGLAVLPANNLTHNLGFGSEATHTAVCAPAYISESLPENLNFPLRHPPSVMREESADSIIFERLFKPSRLALAKQKIRKIPLLGSSLITINRWIKHALVSSN